MLCAGRLSFHLHSGILCALPRRGASTSTSEPFLAFPAFSAASAAAAAPIAHIAAAAAAAAAATTPSSFAKS